MSVITIESNRISPALAGVLRAQREDFNHRFAAQSHLASGIDGQEFLTHLQSTVDPIVASVAVRFPECVRGVANALFDLSLELFASSTMGPHAKFNEVQAVWREILPRVPELLARNAATVAGSLSNAAFNVARQDGARGEFWLAEMKSLAARCETSAQLMDCGKLLAWRSGLVQFRAAAIETARRMKHDLAAAALGLPAATSPDQLAATLTRVAESPWEALKPADRRSSKQLKVMGTIGDFRGFGGEFLRPPIVTYQDNALVASDHRQRWQLLADCYGRLVHRIGAESQQQARRTPKGPQTSGPEKIQFNGRGEIRWNEMIGNFPQLQNVASAASVGQTLAVTLKDSHRVFLLAVT